MIRDIAKKILKSDYLVMILYFIMSFILYGFFKVPLEIAYIYIIFIVVFGIWVDIKILIKKIDRERKECN